MSTKSGILVLVALCCSQLDTSSASPFPLKELGLFEDIKNFNDFYYRLPNTSFPVKYELSFDMKPDQGTSGQFDGILDIELKLEGLARPEKIVLHASMNIDHIYFMQTVGGSNEYVEIDATDFVKSPIGEFLNITLPAVTAIPIMMRLEYRVRWNTNAIGTGFYQGTYTNANSAPVKYAATNFEPISARQFMPCFDEPGIRVPMTLTVKHPQSFAKLFSNTDEPTSNGLEPQTTVFKSTPAISTHLLALFASEFATKPVASSRIKQNIHASVVTNGDADFAASVAGTILGGIESYLKVELSVPKLDHIAADNPFGGVDSYGIIIYNKASILLSKNDPEAESKKFDINENIAYEISHQFFGIMVTPKWWSYLWLSKGLSTLMARYIPSVLNADQEYIYRFQSQVQDAAFNVDGTKAKPLNFYVESPKDIADKFDMISYYKGASVLRMFQRAIGEDIFAKGLEKYLKDLTHLKSVEPEDLIRNLQAAHDGDAETEVSKKIKIKETITNWLFQTGYPTVLVEKSAGKIKLTQSGSTTFSIPITYMTNTSSSTIEPKPKLLWMTTATVDIEETAADQWIVLNIYRDGYYKVDYSKELRQCLYAYLVANAEGSNYKKFPEMNRVEFFRDFSTQVSSKDKKVDDFYGLELMKIAKGEVNGHVWSQINRTEIYFTKKLASLQYYDEYRQFITITLSTQIQRLGWVDKSSDKQNDRVARKAIIAISCRHLNNDCLKMKLDKIKKKDPSLTPQDICDGFRKMDIETYNSLNLNDTEIVKYFPYFSCSMNEQFWSKVLENFTTIEAAKLNQIEKRMLLENGLGFSSGIIKILDVLEQNIDTINNLIGAELYPLLVEIATHMTSGNVHESFMKILDLLEQKPLLTPDERETLKQLADAALQWLIENPGIEDFFKRGDYTTQGANLVAISTFTILLCLVLKSFLN